MMRFRSAQLACTLAALTGRAHAHSDVMVAAYLPEWRYEGANWVDICGTVTHLILFSIEVTQEGSLGALDRIPRKELLEEAKAAATAAGTKLMICVGGNGRSGGFSATVASPKARRRFVKALVGLCEKAGFDGVDLNWEYPGYVMGRGYQSEDVIRQDYVGLRKLVGELRAALGDRALTLAYYPDERQEKLLQEGGFADDVDAMHMMSYDQPGRHSTWEFASRVAEQGAAILPPAKVTLGLPFYARHTRTGDWKSYEDVLGQTGALEPSVDEAASYAGYYFNGAGLIERKVALARRLGLGGVMIWEVGQDCRVNPVTHGTKTHPSTCPAGEASSLLAAIRRALPAAGDGRAAAANDAPTGRDEL